MPRTTARELIRVTTNYTVEDYNKIKQQAAKRNMPLTEYLRRAIARAMFVDEFLDDEGFAGTPGEVEAKMKLFKQALSAMR